jgi:hypothetical protein
MNLYKETVTDEMWELLQRLMNDEKLKDFKLVGGTALSLRIGHRKSIDIDLFTTKDFDSKILFEYLKEAYGAQSKETRLFSNTIMTFIDDIKVDMLTHKYPLLDPPEEREGIRMVTNKDIGAMKLHAIFQSGKRLKDFVDMYFLLDDKPLNHFLEAYEKKYGGAGFLAAHALTYFDNIDWDVNVFMMKGKENGWAKIEKRLKKAVNNPEMTFSKIIKQENNHNIPKKGRGLRR